MQYGILNIWDEQQQQYVPMPVIKGEKGDNGEAGECKSVIKLNSPICWYNTETWQKCGGIGNTHEWSQVENVEDFKVGDIGLIEGYNNETGNNVRILGEVTGIHLEYKLVYLKSIEYLEYVPKVETTYSPTTVKAMSGKALAEALATRDVKYYKIRNQQANFELKKGHIYAFTLKDDNSNAYIEGYNKNTEERATVVGVAKKTLQNMNNGFVLMADRCAAGGLTGTLSLLNLDAYVNDRWDYQGELHEEGYNNFEAPYYLKTTDSTGIDIWEL